MRRGKGVVEWKGGWVGWSGGGWERGVGDHVKVVRCEGARHRGLDLVVGPGVGGDGGFIGCEEGAQVRNQSVAKMGGSGCAEGEGSAKMAWKGGDEGRISGVLNGVGLIVAKKNIGKGGENFVTRGKLSYGKGSREVGWDGVVEGNGKAVAGVENGALSPAEGEVA